MLALNIALIFFIVLETSNIVLLYFAPGSRMGNAMGAFKAFGDAENNPDVPAHRMVRYLVNWVAGTKLIFIVLLIIITAMGGEKLKLAALLGLIISVASFYWRLFPLIRDMDTRGEIIPKGYSRTLAMMIAGFLLIFAGAAAVYLIIAQ